MTPLKRADDHVHKLFWSVWGGPVWRNRLSPESFESMKEFAANVHERRLRGLYVSIDVGDGELPQQAVSDSQCETLIELLRATLAVVDLHEFKELDEQRRAILSGS